MTPTIPGPGLLQEFPHHLRRRRTVGDQIVFSLHLQQADIMILQVGGNGEKSQRRTDQLLVDKLLRLFTGMGEDAVMGRAGRVDQRDVHVFGFLMRNDRWCFSISLRAVSRRSFLSVIRSTMPRWRASSARKVSTRQDELNGLARCLTSWGRRMVPPQPGIRPKRVSGRENSAFLVQMR